MSIVLFFWTFNDCFKLRRRFDHVCIMSGIDSGIVFLDCMYAETKIVMEPGKMAKATTISALLPEISNNQC